MANDERVTEYAIRVIRPVTGGVRLQAVVRLKGGVAEIDHIERSDGPLMPGDLNSIIHTLHDALLTHCTTTVGVQLVLPGEEPPGWL